MNCWKSFNLTKDLGSVRLVILSLIGTICYFVIFNLTFTDLFGPLKIDHFNVILFLFCLLLVYPVHKIMHCVPIWVTGKKVKLSMERESALPRLFCDIKGAMPKRLYMLVILFPFVFITACLCILTFCLPSGIHYYSMIGSINFGISVSDLLYFIYLVSAPKSAIIEDDRDGCHILIKQYI